MHDAWGVPEERGGEKSTFIPRSAWASSYHSSRTVVQGSWLKSLEVPAPVSIYPHPHPRPHACGCPSPHSHMRSELCQCLHQALHLWLLLFPGALSPLSGGA